jgi:sterol desaturase/sphingolipid hydroxylase (fatty acid hydroxylase superfamily)
MDPISDPAAVRAPIFFGLLALLLALEGIWPRRAQPMQRRLRWTSNFGLVVLDTAVLALVPLAALGTALWAEAAGFGLFNALSWPAWLEVALAWLLLDAAIYVQHRAMHEVPLLWRLHRVHHSDTEFDVSTGVRFHPLEILLSMGWKMACVAALGAPLLAVLVLEITLSSFALWSHANLRYPLALDRWLRRLIITPEVHRVHHSTHIGETNSNYGSALMLWDYLFRSYVAQPREGHPGMRIGLDRWRAAADQRLTALLRQPLQ